MTNDSGIMTHSVYSGLYFQQKKIQNTKSDSTLKNGKKTHFNLKNSHGEKDN